MDLINNYLNETCSHIKNKDAHFEIKEELNTHINDLISYYTKHDSSKEEAIKKSLESLGDSSTLGDKLNKVHKSTFDFKLIIIVAILTFIGFIGTFSFNNFSINSDLSPQMLFSFNSVIWLIIGGVAFFIGANLSLNFFKKLYIPMYILGLLMVVFYTTLRPIHYVSELFFAPTISFLPLLPVVPVLLLFALSTMFEKFKPNTLKSFAILSFLGILPLIFIALNINYLPLFVCYSLGLLIIFYINSKNWRLLIAPLFIEIGLFFTVVLNNLLFVKEHFGNTFNSLPKMLEASKLIGQTSGSTKFINSNFTIASSIAVFGYIFGIAICLGLLYFGFRLLQSSYNIKNTYGKSLAFTIAIIIAVQIVFCILVNFNIMPYLEVQTLLISSGGFLFVITLFLLGIFNKIYKYKSLTLLDPQK